MYNLFQSGIRYLKYYLNASNGRGHGVHSPFVFSFITEVLNDDRLFYAYAPIENLRKLLLLDNRELVIEDFGAGSKVKKSNSRSVKDIANGSLKSKKYGQLLFRMVDYFAPQTILELGTSLGITTAYLASARPTSQVITLEGSGEVAKIALHNFNKLRLSNIRLVEGNFDNTLQETLPSIGKTDMVFIDGNHQYEPSVRYFQELLPFIHEYSVLVFDDIHWSSEMEQAWKTICKDDSVTMTIDLFFIGLVFFRKENLQKQHFTIRF